MLCIMYLITNYQSTNKFEYKINNYNIYIVRNKCNYRIPKYKIINKLHTINVYGIKL